MCVGLPKWLLLIPKVISFSHISTKVTTTVVFDQKRGQLYNWLDSHAFAASDLTRMWSSKSSQSIMQISLNTKCFLTLRNIHLLEITDKWRNQDFMVGRDPIKSCKSTRPVFATLCSSLRTPISTSNDQVDKNAFTDSQFTIICR